MNIIIMLVGWRYIGLTFTTSFRKETFHSKRLIESFQEWVWIKSMSTISLLQEGIEEQVT